MELYRVRNWWYEWGQADSIAENNEISLEASISFRRIKLEHLSRRAWIFIHTVNRRLFVAARELSEDDHVFHTLYEMSKTTCQSSVQPVGSLIQKQSNNVSVVTKEFYWHRGRQRLFAGVPDTDFVKNVVPFRNIWYGNMTLKTYVSIKFSEHPKIQWSFQECDQLFVYNVAAPVARSSILKR